MHGASRRNISNMRYWKIKALRNGAFIEIDGLKYEKFIFDALSFTEKNTIIETIREEEFAPVKNAEGVDSPYTARELMSNLYSKWIRDRGISIPGNVRVIEISPLLAIEADDIPEGIRIPSQEMIYLE